ncbi:MAG: GntR family transcriptional regulator [Pseudomonadota bacterium]
MASLLGLQLPLPQDRSKPARTPAPLPAHEVIYRRLREMVLFGDLAPGDAVTIQGLSQELNAGVTPVREAIRRLIAEGALEFQGNRRVCVPETTLAHIDEFVTARQWLDPHMARLATRRASRYDIKDLERIDKDLDRAIARNDIRAYMERNFQFHHQVYVLADTPILAALAEGLWLRFGPLLRVVCARMVALDLPDRHQELLEAMAAKDEDAAANAFWEDVTQGMDQVRAALHTDPRDL